MPRQDRMSANNTSRPRASWGFAAWAACLFVGWAGGCGKTSQGAGKLADGSLGGAGGVKTDAGTGTGGVLGTGGMGTDAGTGTGGAIGTGGVASDAGSGIAYTDDGGVGFAAVARQCAQDSDCTILTAATCCGADRARGIAKAQASAYAGCFALPSGPCGGCAEYLGYLTDTGKTTPYLGTATQPIDLVSVQCVAHLCTTDVVVPPTDAGQDVPSAVDTARDAGSQSCGTTTCHSGQACVLRSGGPAPLCQALGDGGCPPGLVYAASCYTPSMGVQVIPGCTEPAPGPGCVDLPDACGDLCNCICPPVGGGECIVTSAYVLCGYP
jgi:hypothetical protein